MGRQHGGENLFRAARPIDLSKRGALSAFEVVVAEGLAYKHRRLFSAQDFCESRCCELGNVVPSSTYLQPLRKYSLPGMPSWRPSTNAQTPTLTLHTPWRVLFTKPQMALFSRRRQKQVRHVCVLTRLPFPITAWRTVCAIWNSVPSGPGTCHEFHEEPSLELRVPQQTREALEMMAAWADPESPPVHSTDSSWNAARPRQVDMEVPISGAPSPWVYPPAPGRAARPIDVKNLWAEIGAHDGHYAARKRINAAQKHRSRDQPFPLQHRSG